MPIRINLLAEQQAAEDARRRDPVKRAIIAGCALAALMILWSVLLQIKLVSARAELTRFEAKLQAVEDNSKEARAQWATSSQIETRINNLQRYSTNRFFSATLLDALQQLMVDDVRVMQLQSVHAYATNSEASLKTNMVFALENAKSWQIWKSHKPQVSVLTLVSNQISVITNKTEALKTPVDLITKIDISSNLVQATANVEIIKPTTTVEQITLTIKARDYSSPPGRKVDEFSKSLANHPYFAQHLRPGDGEGIRLRERAIQAEIDPTDPVNPNTPFIPFVIECRYRGTTRANE